MRLKKIIMKKTKSEDTISNDLWECVVELLQGVLNLLLLNPLIYPLLTVFIPKIIIGFACKDMYSIMWSFVSVYSTHSGRRNRYWFHYHTRLAYADISEQICVINGTKKEKDFYKIYSQKHVDTKVKSFGFWQNQNLSEDFRIHMLRHGYQITLSDLKFVLEKNQYLVIKEILKQTVSGEKSIIIWNRVIDKDDKILIMTNSIISTNDYFAIIAPSVSGKTVGNKVGDICINKDINLVGSDDKFSVIDNKGKIVIINFWYTSCTPCVQELPHFDELYKKYNEDVVVIAIHEASIYNSDPQAVKNFIDSQFEGFSILFHCGEGY